jgi:hypothetical protein
MDRLTLKANQPVTLIEQIAATAYTVQPKDNNAVLGFTASAAVHVTLPPTLPEGFKVELLQMGTGQITAQGANMVSPQGTFTTPVQYAALDCAVLSNPSGSAATWRVSSGGAGGAAGGGGSAATVTSYTAIRGTTFPPTANLITLSDPHLGGTFVPGTLGQRDDGGTCIHDASGKPWSRLVESRVNAQWFYSKPGGYLGDSSGAQITATDVINNPQWVGLPTGQGMYPPGTYWDYICLQEWLYACAGARSSPPAVFQGSITSAILTVSAWISGPHSLSVGQQLAGANIVAGTAVVYDFGDGIRYGVGIPQITGSLGSSTQPCTATPSGSQFACYITNPQGSLLVSNALYAGPAPQVGDLIAAPPGGVPPYGVILPGCYILATTQGPGVIGNWIVGVCAQDVLSEQMNVVGGAIWNKQGGAYSLNRAGWCPNGYMDTNQLLGCCAVGLDLVFEHRSSSVIRWHGNMGGQQLPAAQWSTAGPGVLFNAISYSGVDNLCVSDTSATGCTGWLVSVDYDPNSQPFVTGLAPQANTFRDWFIGGGGPSTHGAVALAKAGGAAQTDTQVFINLFTSSTLNGVWIGGANAIGILFIGGNFVVCPGRSIDNEGAGCFSSVNTLFEAAPYNYYVYPQVNQITMDGADIYSSEVGTENSYSVGTRSESIVACIDVNYSTELHAYTMAQAAGFGSYPAAGFGVAAHQHLGYSLFPAGGGNNFSLVMAVDDSGPDWQLGQLNTALTVITFSTPFTGAISGGLLTVDAMGQYGGQLNIGDEITGPGVPGGVTVSGFNYGTGGQAGTYTLAGAAGVNVADGAALTAQPNWPANAFAGWPIAIRYASNGYAAWTGIQSSTANTVTLTAAAVGWPSAYPTAFKIQSQTGTAPINWLGVPTANFGRTNSNLKNSPGYGWSVKQGSNWVTGNSNAPVGAYAVVPGAQRFTVQKPGQVGDVGALIGKVGAVNNGGTFQGSILYSTLTVTTTPTQPLRAGQGVSGAPGTRVTGQLTGPAGGAGTYSVDSPQIYPQSAQFGGSITGNVLTVGNGYQGVPQPGDYLIGATGTVPVGTQLVGLLSGTAGATGSTWQLNNPVNSGYDWMYTGSNTSAVAMVSTLAFSLVHPYDGKPLNSGVTANDMTGYWGQPIWDGGPGGAGGGIAWIPIDFDAMWGVKQFTGGQIPYGKGSRMGPMDSEDQPSTLLSPTSSFVRDTTPAVHRRLLPTGPGPSIAPGVQYLNTNPFTVPVANNNLGIGGTKSLYFWVEISATLNLPQLPANLELDLDIIFEQFTATPYTITWGTSATGGNAPIRAPNPTLTLGSANQITTVRLKWLGNKYGTAGVWIVTSITGPS